MGRATRFAIGLLLYAVAIPLHAATITVTNTNDSGPGSLRQALAVAHDGDRITFAVSGTIMLTSGGLGVAKNVTISGPGANQLAVDGNQGTLVFGLPPLRTVSISGLTIRNAQYGISNNQGTVSVSNCVISGHSVAGLYNYAGQGSDGASMTVANSIISNNSGTGAFNLFPMQFSGGGGRACMTITDSVVSNNNADGMSNQGNAFSGTASLTVVNSNVSDNAGSGISNDGTEGITSATILSTTVSDNSVGGVSSGAFFGGAGVTITDCTISGNSTNGGILAGADTFLTVANSTISDNLSGETGGGIDVISALVSIVNSTISGNSAGTSGGGIYCFENVGPVSIVNSTISGNSAGDSGGGIYNSNFGDQDSSIVNSTISGNSAGTSGGGIYNVGVRLHVANSTITGNSAGSGGGIYDNQSVVGISNTIFNAGASGENIFNNGGTVISGGYNLSSDDGGGYLTGPGDQINTDPLLGPLQNNGGPTFTHALLPGSPAIDAGDPNFTPPPFHDQRGPCYYRVFGRSRRIDIGSVETQPERPCPNPPRPRPTSR
jgi:Right handed beta helix region